MPATLYHNPRCSKSRAALALINERGIDVDVVEYLKQPPDRRTLKNLIKLLGDDASALVRTGDEAFRSIRNAEHPLDAERVVEILLAHPKLLQRPIFVADGRARIGRPPEKILEIL